MGKGVGMMICVDFLHKVRSFYMEDRGSCGNCDVNKREQQTALCYREMYAHNLAFSEAREGELADEFTRLEVQIAVVLIAFEGVFIESIGQKLSDIISSLEAIFVLKFFYATSIASLLLSLILGLILIKRKEHFWGAAGNVRNLNLRQWIKVINGEQTYQQAKSYQEGTNLGVSRQVSPAWAWILQTIFLGVAVSLFFVIFLVLVFLS